MKYFPNKLSEKDIEKILNQYRKIKDEAHNETHIIKVLLCAKDLINKLSMTEQQGNLIIAIVVCHDLGNLFDRDNHHIIGRELVKKHPIIIKRFSPELVKVISDGVYHHRSSQTLTKNFTKIERVMRDADKLSAFLSFSELLVRPYKYKVHFNPNMNKHDLVMSAAEHMIKKFGIKGHGYTTLHFKESKVVIKKMIDKLIILYQNKKYSTLYKMAGL